MRKESGQRVLCQKERNEKSRKGVLLFMTMPNERTRAVVWARDFLRRLSSPCEGGIKGVPKAVREEARRVLRHFPHMHELGMEDMFDEGVIEEYYAEQDKKWDLLFKPAKR